METKLFMGCDIAQDSFAFCLRDQAEVICEGEVLNTKKTIHKWLKELKQAYRVDLTRVIFCMEHTGIYGMMLIRTLHSRSLTVCVEGAANIKLSLGLQRGKNDRVDARRIAEYAMRYTDRLKQWKPKREVLERLQLLNGMRSRLIKAKNVLTSHTKEVGKFLGKKEYMLLDKGTKQSLRAIEANIEKVDKDIKALIKSDENLKRLCDLVTSVDSIGMVTCAVMLVKTNEFQDYTEAKKFACTAGLAPFEHSSGKSVRGKTRVSHRAHKDLKTLLHMCALGAVSRKGELQDFYQRKVGQGKNKMLVLNAVRNKLVHRVFAVVRDGVIYQKNYQYNLVMS
ncbi:MAG: IS110 family transposase [Actinobacteria bacterium]|nr:IS110 family transposase [Actinomycetota bacterium]